MMKHIKEQEIKGIYGIVISVFLIFLLVPLLLLLGKSFEGEGGISLVHYGEILAGKGFLAAFGNSILLSFASAATVTALAFVLAYTIYYTNVPKEMKRFIRLAAVAPMLLPTIAYGFAIRYSFGEQGLITRLLGGRLLGNSGFAGLWLGYVIYTLPTAFMLIVHSMSFIDKKLMIVSRVMGDSPFRTFLGTILRPLLGTLAASFVQCFVLCFTDYGIPESVGGEIEVLATVLYSEILGSVPNLNRGAAMAVLMLIPSALSIFLLHCLGRYNIRSNEGAPVEIRRGKLRDILCGLVSCGILIWVLSIFAVVFAVPLTEEWPYRLSFTAEHIRQAFSDQSLLSVYENTLLVAGLTALAGSLTAYGAALAVARSNLSKRFKRVIDRIALMTKGIPGMVIGIAFLFAFSGTPVENTFFILVICNVVHFFFFPYRMMKGCLSKMNASWETTALLMGDTWLKTIVRVVTPNAMTTLLKVFSYYFINAMVAVNAAIFIAGVRTAVIPTKIKELQDSAKSNEIFVLSLLTLATNLAVRGLFRYLAARKENAGVYREGNLEESSAMDIRGLSERL